MKLTGWLVVLDMGLLALLVVLSPVPFQVQQAQPVLTGSVPTAIDPTVKKWTTRWYEGGDAVEHNAVITVYREHTDGRLLDLQLEYHFELHGERRTGFLSVKHATSEGYWHEPYTQREGATNLEREKPYLFAGWIEHKHLGEKIRHPLWLVLRTSG